MRHIPNIITIFRILATPVIGLLLARHEAVAALGLTFVAGMSDFADGYLSRRFGWGSKLGAVLDPLADKIFVVSLFLGYGFGGSLPWWLVGLVLGRDALILVFGSLAMALTKVKSLPPSIWGKISTGFQMLLAGGVVMQMAWRWLIPDWLLVGLMGIVTVMTVWSGVHYGWTGYQRLKAAD